MSKSCQGTKYTSKLVFLGILIFTCRQLPAVDLPSAFIADDSALRDSIKNVWLTENPETVLKNRTFVRNLPGGSPVEVRAEARNGEFSVILARERNGGYPGWAQGSWIYTRNRSGGTPVRIRVFLRSDPQLFVQWRPLAGDKSQMDVVVYGAYVVRGMPVGIPFDRLLTMPVEEILAAAGDRFPRRYFDPDPALYRNSNSLVTKLRMALPSLDYADDGAIDETGRYVLIETLGSQNEPVGLNCSGFAKWVVDGMLFSVTGERLAIAPLKEPAAPRTSTLAANEQYDLLFGLDWTRNLALEAAKALRSPGFAALENVEVRKETFAALIDRSGGSAAIESYPGFLLNAGFGTEGLRPLLYTLAVNEPGHVYLASINRELRTMPPQRQHYHIAALVPYFNEFGVFQIAVFESAAETTFAGFLHRHPGSMANLVRVPVEGSFNP